MRRIERTSTLFGDASLSGQIQFLTQQLVLTHLLALSQNEAAAYPARAAQDVARDVAIPSAVLTVVVNGLEAAGWSFERFLQQDSLERVHRAAREAVQVAASHTKGSASAVLPLLRPALFKVLLPVVAQLTPFDLETYLKVHFTKVGEQTRLMMRTYVDLGRSAGLPVEHLQAASR